MSEIAFRILRAESDGTGCIEFEIDPDSARSRHTLTREEAIKLAYWILSEVTEPAWGYLR